MEEDEKIERIELFLCMLKEELQKLRVAGLSYMQFVILGQTIEVLGSFLDSKPMKAKEQSAKRFSAAVNYLLGGKYRLLNDKRVLYDKLRNQMTHTFLPGNDLLLLSEDENFGNYKHLEVVDHQLVLVSAHLFEDVERAIDKLSDLLKSGKLKPKNISFGKDE